MCRMFSNNELGWSSVGFGRNHTEELALGVIYSLSIEIVFTSFLRFEVIKHGVVFYEHRKPLVVDCLGWFAFGIVWWC